MNSDRRTASLFGWLFIATFVLSIPAFFIFYAPVLDTPEYITGAGADENTIVGLGAVSEVLLIIANVGTAVVIFPILKRFSETGAIAYVSARLVKAMFIAMGIISILAILFLRKTPRASQIPHSARCFSRCMIGRSLSARGSSPVSPTGSSSDT